MNEQSTRRRFLRYLAASPVLFGAGRSPGRGDTLLLRRAADENVEAIAQFVSEQGRLIDSPEQAVNVFDFEATARQKVPRSHFAYIATGVDNERTLRGNREALGDIQLRVRRMIDTSNIDTSVELFGKRWETPIIVQPCGSQKAFHPDGEAAVAHAARQQRHLQVLSTVTTTAVEEVNEIHGEPVWYQLYPTNKWEITQALLRRVEAAGCPVVVLTVDNPVGGNRETSRRGRLEDSRDCSLCHAPASDTSRGYFERKPMFDGLDLAGVTGVGNPAATWEFIDRIKDATTMKLVVKGIVTREDARLCVEHGVDGLVVSNHGGRSEPSGKATIERLPEVLGGVSGRVPVIIDGGFRRGTDILKALVLGATALGIGRPYLWGLGALAGKVWSGFCRGYGPS